MVIEGAATQPQPREDERDSAALASLMDPAALERRLAQARAQRAAALEARKAAGGTGPCARERGTAPARAASAARSAPLARTARSARNLGVRRRSTARSRPFPRRSGSRRWSPNAARRRRSGGARCRPAC